MKPQNLEVAPDYRLALLWLMSKLESGRRGDVLAAFEEEFGEIIPVEHRDRNASGYIKWQHYVDWARVSLVHMGFVGSGRRGVWTITSDGGGWLRSNPKATHADLTALRRRMKRAGAEGAKSQIAIQSRRDGDTGRSGFRWQGKQYAVDGQALLSKASQLLRAGPPPEALRYKDWAALVDGQPVSVKWLFSLATGADYNEFDSPTARRALSQIGIDVQQAADLEQAPRVAAEPTRGTNRVKQRDEFLAQVAGHLSAQLPAQAGHGQIRALPGRNYLLVVYAEFPRSHYELRLARGFDEVAFHLEGRREDNLARLAVIAPHQEELTEALGHRVVAEPWEPNWARLAIDLPRAPWTDNQAKEYASLLARFIDVTFVTVGQAFAAVRTQRRAPAKSQPAAAPSADGAAHAVLDRQLAQVRSFLQGRSPRPSDEVLCDWVHFCYTFELFSEGQELFNLVVPSAVNDWLYARTRRLALVCRMRAGAGRQEQG